MGDQDIQAALAGLASEAGDDDAPCSSTPSPASAFVQYHGVQGWKGLSRDAVLR
jgi:hypothetical protein